MQTCVDSRTVAIEIQILGRWARIANDVLGTLAFTLGVGAASTENPQFFALLSMAFVLFAGFRSQRPYQRIYRLWRELKHPFVKPSVIWRHYSLFIFGWSFLGLVALEAVDKTGPTVPPLVKNLFLLAQTALAT
jgi:hypothetical protein